MIDPQAQLNVLRSALIHTRSEWTAWQRDRPPTSQEMARAGERGEVEVDVTGDGDLPVNLVEAVEWLRDRLKAIPPKLRASAELRIEGEYDDGSTWTTVQVAYRRPETDAEWAERRADVDRRWRLSVSNAEATERAAYEHLKARFG